MAFNYVPVRYNPEAITRHVQNMSEKARERFFSSMEFFLGSVIFPLIDPEPFSILYANSSAPCYPVNILIAAEYYKFYRMLSDQDLIDFINMSPDLRFALHMHDYFDGEHVFSMETLTRFRSRCQNYYNSTKIDLMRDAGIKIADELTRMLDTDTSLQRIDSGFIDSHIEHLSRMKLLYVFVQLAAKSIVKVGVTLDGDLEHYTQPNDWNQISYYDETTPCVEKTSRIIEEGLRLIHKFENDELISQLDDFLYLKRVMDEQTLQDEDGTFRLRKNKEEGLSPNTLQSPADTDATFRSKAGEKHRGYIGLIVESGSGSSRVRNYWEYALNTTGDATLLEQYLRSLKDAQPGSKPVILVGDGLFSGAPQKALASRKNMRIITTDLAGKKPDMFLNEFKRDNTGIQIVECPNHQKPIKCTFNEKNDMIRAHFSKEACMGCPLRDKCRAAQQVKSSVIAVTRSAMDRAADWKGQKQDKDYGFYAAYRAGVEANFSLLRRKYRIDQMPVREFVPTRYRFDVVMTLINIKQAYAHFTQLANS